ncbi:MAG: hypothetical protein ACOH5I_25495 [Oligoflexus sp.]
MAINIELLPYLADEISLAPSFDRSTNLEADFNNKKKIDTIYISEKFASTLIDIIHSVLNEDSNQRVRVFSGSPGLGKSTFALLLLKILSKNQTTNIRQLLAKAETNNVEELSELLESFITKKRGNKLLPIIINGYEGDIEKAFLHKLEKAFSDADLANEWKELLVKTTDLTSIIRDWKKNYPRVYDQYLSSLNENLLIQKSFESGLRKGQLKNREKFLEICEQVTGRTNANTPSSDVIHLYKSATKLLSERGYGGVFVVYDEFGKYLEKGIHSPSSLNVQFLQDFAEFCDRSGEYQCHLVLITHMSVSQYASQLPINIQNEWAKIEGRFQENSFYDRSVNYYRLIEKVFEKKLSDNKRSKLYRKARSFYSNFVEVFNKVSGLEGFLDAVSVDLIINCFPLHPISLAFLPFLSQKVSQNERTLYTFLTREEDHSLNSFLQQSYAEDEIPLLMPSRLYLYFSNSIKRDLGPGGVYRIGLIAEEALNTVSAKDSLAHELLSIIALSEVIKMPRLAPVNEEFLKASLIGLYTHKDVAKKLKELQEQKLIFYNRFRERFELRQGSSVDLQEELDKGREIKLTSKDLVGIIKKYNNYDYIITKKYNFSHNICRFYETCLISVEELKGKKFRLSPDYDQTDGIVYYILPFDQDELAVARELVDQVKSELVVFILPNKFIECRKDIEELNAINSLYSNKELLATGPLVRKELDFHKSTVLKSIERVLDPVVGRFGIDVTLKYNKIFDNVKCRSFIELQRYLGEVFTHAYSSSIDINSELINKHKVSSSVTLARRIFIQHLIENPDKNELAIEGNGPEKALYYAIKEVSDVVWDNTSNKLKLGPKNKLDQLYKMYQKMLAKSSSGVSFETIIDTFSKPPFGLRKAVIPCYIAIFDLISENQVNHYFQDAYVSNPDGEHYDLIFRHPKLSRIQMTKITDVHEVYLRTVATAFGAKQVDSIPDIVSAIFNWRKAIPEYVKYSDEVSIKARRILVAIDSAEEPDKLLFKSLPESLRFNTENEDYLRKPLLVEKELQEALIDAKQAYSNLLFKIRDHLEEAIQILNDKCLSKKLRIDTKKDLAGSYKLIFSALESRIRNHKFSKVTTHFIERFMTFDTTSHKQYFVETIGDVLTGASPRVWEGKTINLFLFTLHKVMEEIIHVSSTVSSELEGHSVVAITNISNNQSRYIDLGAKQGLKTKHLKLKNEILEKFEDDWSPTDIKILLVDLLSTLDLN